MEGGVTGRPGLKLLLLLLASLFLNTFLCSYFFLPREGEPGLGWSWRAAEEAEAVAAFSCSGHGNAFLDSLVVDGRLTCECNNCYSGADCSVFLPDCPANADSGNPVFLEPYWRQHAASSAIVVSGWHRMGYSATGENFISVELERRIRLLHKAIGNAVTDGRFIIFGVGSTQLINAALDALSPDHNTTTTPSSPASVVASIPYYPMYKNQTKFLDNREYVWKGVLTSTSSWANQSSERDLIEFVTSPNNPDGLFHHSILRSSAAIHDHAYYWPHFSAIPAPADEDVMLFSCSKLSGHASTRFGWALIKDEKVYQRMTQYLLMNTMGVSRDSQLRVLQILKTILAGIGGGGDIFKYGYKTQAERWHKLSRIISLSNRFSLQEISPQYCNYFKTVRNPSPAYAWLKCEREEDRDCAAVLEKAGIISRSGAFFEDDSSYTRLSLIKTQDDFNQLLQRFKDLIYKELGSKFDMKYTTA